MNMCQEIVNVTLSFTCDDPARVDKLVSFVVGRVAAEGHGILLVHLQSADTCTESWKHSSTEMIEK